MPDAIALPSPLVGLEPREHPRPRPGHVAIIMDGNGRWADRRGLPKKAGHRQGVEAVRRVVRAAGDGGIRYLTLYGFSADNWRRPAGEISSLMNLLRRFIKRDLADLHQRGVHIRVIGSRDGLAADIVRSIDEAERLTRHNDALILTVAFNYGGRNEIVSAARRIADDVRNGTLSPDAVDADVFEKYLETSGLPAPDLVIRTSGEQRLSDFLLWQSAYAELIFMDLLWPDFNAESFQAALDEYARRNRRFGARPDSSA